MSWNLDNREALKMFSQGNYMLKVMFQKEYPGRNMENRLGMENNRDMEADQEVGKRSQEFELGKEEWEWKLRKIRV